MISYVDTHTHLHFQEFDRDREAVIQRAGDAGVAQIITLGTDLASSRRALTLARQYPNLFAGVGIHPSEAHLTLPGDEEQIAKLARENPTVVDARVVAIGEIGLDFYWDRNQYQAQYAIFRKMIDLAKIVDLPVVIHNRSAHREMAWFFQDEGIYELKGVMHCFSGEVVDARFYLDMGLHISFTADITRRNFRRTAVINFVPLDRLLIETDSPYISPAQVPEKRNEPANVRYVAEKLADIHRLTVEEIARITTGNARRLFRLPGKNACLPGE